MITPPEGTREPSARHRFDEAALASWLDAHAGGVAGPLTVRQFAGGQSNPTFWIGDGARGLVLRKKPPGVLLPSAHAIEREHRVITALDGTGVPVARAVALCEDPAILGTPFFVMEHVAGRIFWDVRLPGLAPGERRAIHEEQIRVLAAIHAVDVDAVGLADYGKRGRYVARQIARWSEQYRAAETDRIPSMDALMAWLPAHVPENDETALAHGDFRLDNLIFHREEPRVLAVIDWELSTLGHPLADLAYTCMLYDVFLPRVGGLAGADLAALGIPTEAEQLERYRRLTGRASIEAWPTFKAFSLFRLAAIAQGVYKRSLDGNASSDDAAVYRDAVGLLGGIACRLVGIDPPP